MSCSHPLQYPRPRSPGLQGRGSVEHKSRVRRPPPVILTPHSIPEFVIPRSPSLQSNASDASDNETSDWTEERETRRSFRRTEGLLAVPDPMRKRSLSNPNQDTMYGSRNNEGYRGRMPRCSPEPRLEADPRYQAIFAADEDTRARKYSHQPRSSDRLVDDFAYRRYSRDERYREEENRSPSYSLSERRSRTRSPTGEGYRRRLPPTPEELHKFSYDVVEERRTPSRQLPTEPVRSPPMPETASPPSRPVSGTGRRLPSIPSTDLSDSFRTESRQRQAQKDIATRHLSQTPPLKSTRPPTISNSYTNGYTTYPPDVHEARVGSPNSRKYCQRRPSEQSVDDYVETPCTCPDSFSSMSPIQEPTLSHSSSDTEDPSALGIAPEIYHQQANSGPSPPLMQTSTSSHSGFVEFRESSVDRESPTKTSPAAAASPRSSGVPTSSSWSESSQLGVKKTGLGFLHFCIQYFPVRKRLRISIMKAEGLAGQLRPELELHTFVKISLMPGKIGKQQSRIVKRTRDAVFNQEFFFDNVGTVEIKNKAVSIRVCHHVGKQFQKDIMIGELEVPLKDVPDLLTKKEIRLTQELKPKLNMKKLGRLQVSTCLEKEARRLTINVFKADDLPKYGISGPPDPCVRVTVNQNGRIQTKQSRILKHTTSAVYREAIMFLVSTKAQDLENTEVTMSVHDTSRTATGDDLIGQAFLGILATEKAEMDQWRNTVQNPGKEYKATHTLRLTKEE